MRTMFPRAEDVKGHWYIVDAAGLTLGRMAANIATVLRGKHRADFTPYLDLGDHVVVINAAKMNLTGKKAQNKQYFSHSMYPGGASFTPMHKILSTRPERLVELAVKGMLPKNRLGRKLLSKLKVYGGAEHPHQAQQPVRMRLARTGSIAEAS